MNIRSKSQTKNYYDFLLKCILVGDSCTGKTSLILKYYDNSFSSSYIPTFGVDFKAKTTKFEEIVIKTQILDPTSFEKFRRIVETYYRESRGAIVMYSISDRKSFMNVEKWMKSLFTEIPVDAVFILVGNKCDEESREVETSEGKEMADSYDMPFFEVSAKEGINVNEVFQELIKRVMSQKKGLKE